MARLLLSLLMALSFFQFPTYAQAPDITDILQDILGGPQPQGHTTTDLNYIENIPVNVIFDSRRSQLPPDSTLILTAIAPPPTQARRQTPLIMGETRIMVSRLVSPLSLVIAVPRDMARDLDFALIDAKIIDRNGNPVFDLINQGRYDGTQPPFLQLEPIGADGQPAPSTNANSARDELIDAVVDLPRSVPISRGSTLVLQVTEAALADGGKPAIRLEQRIDIDQKKAPYSVTLTVPLSRGRSIKSAHLVAYVEDWTGLKTFVYPSPVAIKPGKKGKRSSVFVKLDPIIRGDQAIYNPQDMQPPAPPRPASRPLNSAERQTITGRAQFSAWKGLPSGAVMQISLRDAANISEIIKSTHIPLSSPVNGQPETIAFSIDVEQSLISQRRTAPVIMATIVSADGRPLLSTRTLPQVSQMEQTSYTLELFPDPTY